MSISLTKIAHQKISEILTESDSAIDATCGNGYDTLFLSETVGPTGRVFSFDIQQQAIDNTQQRILNEGLENIQLIQACHSKMLELLNEQEKSNIKIIMFNLGYLPGSDKTIITQTPTTLMALNSALNLISVGGLITIIVYPGHNGGKLEADSIIEQIDKLPKSNYQIEIILGDENNHLSPKLICIYRI